MNRRFFTKLFSILFLLNSVAWAAPTENPTQTLLREQGMYDLKADLTKNKYKQVSYEYPYDVQVPYQAEETYYEDVPYQETVEYTDYEEYYDQEYKCHDRTDWVRECNFENRCRRVPNRVCQNERVCRIERGNDQCEDVERCHNGECRTHRVCRPSPGNEVCENVERCHNDDREECTRDEVCNNVPRTRQECGYEQVRKTRPVKKYRNETRYRKEERTRTVTRYRTEQRCCKTGYRDEFTHQVSLPVLVRLPKEAELAQGETEKFRVAMASDTSAQIQMLNTVFGYNVVKQEAVSGTWVIDLSFTPKYKATELAEKTIANLAFVLSKKENVVSFTDSGLRAHVESRYLLEILDAATGEQVDKIEGVSEGVEKVRKVIGVTLDPQKKWLAKLSVHREGMNLEGLVDFAKEVEGTKKAIVAPEDPMDSGLSKIYLDGSALDSEIYFTDSLSLSTEVTTEYQLTLSVEKKGKKSPIAMTSLSPQQSEQVAVNLARDFALSSADAETFLQSGKRIWIDLEVIRTNKKGVSKKLKRALDTRIK